MKGTTSLDGQRKKRLISMDDKSDAELSHLQNELKTSKSDVVKKALSDLALKIKDIKRIEQPQSITPFELQVQQERAEFNSEQEERKALSKAMDEALKKKRNSILSADSDGWTAES